MVHDKITQFELYLIELNRNIAYNEKSEVIKNYTIINNIYKEILKSKIPQRHKEKLYNSIMDLHENIQTLNKTVPTKQISYIGASIITSFLFMLKGPQITGMVTLSEKYAILSPITRFLPALILLGIVLLKISKNKTKNNK